MEVFANNHLLPGGDQIAAATKPFQPFDPAPGATPGATPGAATGATPGAVPGV